MEKSAVYYERGEKNRGQPRSFEGHRGVFMEYCVDLEKNATDRAFWRKFFSWEVYEKKKMYEKGHFFMFLSNFLLVNYYISLLFQQVMFE